MVPVPLARATGVAIVRAVMGRQVTQEERYEKG